MSDSQANAPIAREDIYGLPTHATADNPGVLGAADTDGSDATAAETNDHLTLLYDDFDDQMAAVVPFLKEGLNRGERCLYVVDDNTKADVVAALSEAGVDVDRARDTGTLSLHTAEETYLKQGEFDPAAMIQFWRDTLADVEDAHTGLRAAAEMTWAVDGETDPEVLATYETLLNSLYAGDDYVVLCQYNQNRFPATILSDILRSHPLLVTDTTIYPNCHYLSPPEFCETAREPLNIERALTRITGETVVTAPTTPTHATTIEADEECLLLALRDDDNERVLADWLRDEYDTVVTGDLPETLTTTDPDLCVVDRETFDVHREGLIDAKEDVQPELLPYLLLNRQDTLPQDADLRDYADEVITMPTDKETLAWRINTLLQLRDQSQQVAQKQEQIEHLANAAAHDLRNPLSVAQGWLEKVPDSEAVEKIAHALDRMEKLIDNVLAVAKTGDPFNDEDVEAVEPENLVRGCWEVVPTKQATLHIEDGLPSQMEVEPVLTRQLFENLFRNAVEHGGDDIDIYVGTVGTSGFYVKDNGEGIPADEREKVFDEGYSTESGSGLGTTVIKRVAEYHGWTMHYMESADGGARFEFMDVETL